MDPTSFFEEKKILMEVRTFKLAADSAASLTAYLQTPTPKSPVRKFWPLIFVPGGSMTHIPVEETEKTAIAFAARGFQVFTLRYSFTSEKSPLYPAPLIDLANAVKLVKDHAKVWHLAKRHLILMGFSAGGHVVSLYNDYWASDWLRDLTGIKRRILKPRAVILGYPVIDLDKGFPPAKTLPNWTDDVTRYNASLHVNRKNRPTFLWTTYDDDFVSVTNTMAYANALSREGVPMELHVFTHGPHGLDIANALTAHHPGGDNPHVAHWVQLACEWVRAHPQPDD